MFASPRHFLLGLALGVQLCLAQPAPLSLSDCIRLALAAQSNVSIARQETEITRRAVSVAKAGFAPLLRVGNGYSYNSPSANGLDPIFVALNGVHEYVSQAIAAEELDTSGRLRAGLARARADQAVAEGNLLVTQRDLKRAVTAAYYRLLLSRHLVKAGRDSLDEAVSFEKRSKALVEGGEAARADLAKAAAQAAFLEQGLNAAQLENELANQDLASFWTTDVAAPLDIADNFEQAIASPEDMPGSGQAPFLSRPEFRVFEAQRNGMLAEVRRARADLYPQTSFVYQYGLDATRLTFADRGHAAFVSFNIPVFDFFRARNTAKQFQFRAQTVDSNRQISERLFSRDYQAALSRVRMIYLQISIANNQVTASEQNLKMSQVRYEGGEGLALDVVSAQAQLAQARSNYFTAIAGYLNARADLEVAAGR